MKTSLQTLSSALLVATLIALAGCASGTGGKDYSRAQTRSVQKARC